MVCVTEEDILEALREEADMLDTVPSAIDFEITIKHVVPMKPALSVVERIHEVQMAVAHLLNKNGWISAVWQRFNFVSRYGRFVVEVCWTNMGRRLPQAAPVNEVIPYIVDSKLYCENVFIICIHHEWYKY